MPPICFATIPFRPLIALDKLELANGHTPLLDQASLVIDKGERIGLIGRNAAGKV